MTLCPGLQSERRHPRRIERELAGRESGVDAAEDRLAESIDRLSREIRGIRLARQALFAFLDSLVKPLLTCVAEPTRDACDQAVARGKVRYDRFLKSVGGKARPAPGSGLCVLCVAMPERHGARRLLRSRAWVGGHAGSSIAVARCARCARRIRLQANGEPMVGTLRGRVPAVRLRFRSSETE
jgi:hypothetical protein